MKNEKRIREIAAEIACEIAREEIESRYHAFDDLWTVRRFCKWKYETDFPTKAQINAVSRMCLDGTLPAMKVGREWRIDTAEIMRGERNEEDKTRDAA